AGGDRLPESALVACADPELNVSSFAARVAASTGADLEACLLAALAAFSGPRHGAESMRVQALVAEAGRPDRARSTLLARTRRGEALPGFGHRLYPTGDPRGPLLLSLARQQRPRRSLAALAALGSGAGGGVRGNAAGARCTQPRRGAPRSRARLASATLGGPGPLLHRPERGVDRPRRRAADLGRAAATACPLRGSPEPGGRPGER